MVVYSWVGLKETSHLWSTFWNVYIFFCEWMTFIMFTFFKKAEVDIDIYFILVGKRF